MTDFKIAYFQVPYACGFVMLSYGTAFVLSLMFEAPMIGLEKILKKKKR